MYFHICDLLGIPSAQWICGGILLLHALHSAGGIEVDDADSLVGERHGDRKAYDNGAFSDSALSINDGNLTRVVDDMITLGGNGERGTCGIVH
jgi:hypothetical protein